jgi:uncharacterized protein YdhG (YjbR/CyaY superfamily)
MALILLGTGVGDGKLCHFGVVISHRGEKPLFIMVGYRLERPHGEWSWYEGGSHMSVDDKKATKKPAKASQGFTTEERSAIRERVKEQKATSAKADGELDVLEKIAALPAPDRSLAERIHAIVKANAPSLAPKTWYGMPAYAKDGKIVCFFQSADKFKTRYATLGFNDSANLDDGGLWPVSFALKQLTAVEEAKIAALVKKAVS